MKVDFYSSGFKTHKLHWKTLMGSNRPLLVQWLSIPTRWTNINWPHICNWKGGYIRRPQSIVAHSLSVRPSVRHLSLLRFPDSLTVGFGELIWKSFSSSIMINFISKVWVLLRLTMQQVVKGLFLTPDGWLGLSFHNNKYLGREKSFLITKVYVHVHKSNIAITFMPFNGTMFIATDVLER